MKIMVYEYSKKKCLQAIVKYHISEICKRTGKGLARFTEQTTKAVYHDFGQTWSNKKVAENHVNYDESGCIV